MNGVTLLAARQRKLLRADVESGGTIPEFDVIRAA